MAMIGKFVIKSVRGDMSGRAVNENIGDVICDDLWSADSTTRLAKATQFDNFGRAVVNNLTTNLYDDAEITVTQSVNAILGE